MLEKEKGAKKREPVFFSPPFSRPALFQNLSSSFEVQALARALLPPRGAHSRLLALSKHSQHVPRVRSQDSAARAGRDGDGSSSAGKRGKIGNPWNFFARFPCSLGEGGGRRDSAPPAREEQRETLFALSRSLRRVPLPGSRGAKKKKKEDEPRSARERRAPTRPEKQCEGGRVAPFFFLSFSSFSSSSGISLRPRFSPLSAPPHEALQRLSKGD